MAFGLWAKNHIGPNGDHGGSGGSPLPPVTSADLGKVMAVVKSYTKGAVIVPEQSVTHEMAENEEPLVGANVSLFTNGAAVIAVVEASEETAEYTATVDSNGNAWIDSYCVYRNGDNLSAFDDDGVYPFTITLYATEPVYEWDIDPYPGLDFVAIITGHPRDTISINDVNIVKGSYKDIDTQIRAGNAQNGAVFFVDSNEPILKAFVYQSTVFDIGYSCFLFYNPFTTYPKCVLEFDADGYLDDITMTTL